MLSQKLRLFRSEFIFIAVTVILKTDDTTIKIQTWYIIIGTSCKPLLANQVINQMSVSVLCITVFIEKQHRSLAVLKRLETDPERSTVLSWILVLHLLSTASLVSKTNSVIHEISSILDQHQHSYQ